MREEEERREEREEGERRGKKKGKEREREDPSITFSTTNSFEINFCVKI